MPYSHVFLSSCPAGYSAPSAAPIPPRPLRWGYPDQNLQKSRIKAEKAESQLGGMVQILMQRFFETLAIFAVSIGGIFMGWFTPTDYIIAFLSVL